MTAAPPPRRRSSSAAAPPARPPGHWLARAGHDVVVVEKKTFPREKTCGDGLTPRAVTQLHEHGPRGEDRRQPPPLRRPALHRPRHHPRAAVAASTRCTRATATSCAGATSTRWSPPRPRPAAPRCSRAPRRCARSSATACSRGAVVKDKASGEEREIHARYVVIADGSLSRFGRALGNQRDKRLLQGMAIRGYFESPLHADPWIESALDVRDRNGDALPGYGWIFPCGDGTINVGIGLLSTFRGWKDDQHHPPHARVGVHRCRSTGASTPTPCSARPPSGRLPMGGSIHPKCGPTWIVDRRRRRVDQPVQRRGHRLRLRDRAHGRRPHRRGARDRARPCRWPATPTCSRRSTASTSGWPAPSPWSSASPPSCSSSPASACSRAVAHGVGAADHGQPAAPRRARPRRGRLQGRRHASPAIVPGARSPPRRVDARVGSVSRAMSPSGVVAQTRPTVVGGRSRCGGGRRPCRRRRDGTCRPATRSG